ncbi:hypothetical protein U0070_006568 [Myodes glareolus]|uniref:Uncharacterized protein n=1 Tax=Myodes glareolus TaxID=447135 RepID=A0AAW0J5F1_MYOGA
MCLPLGIFWGLVVIFRSCNDLQPLSCLSSPADPLTQYLLLSIWLQMVLLHMTCVIQPTSDDRGCAALVGEDQPLCPDLPELDLSELDVNDLDTDSFLGGLKWCSDQSEIISNQYNNEPANIFEVSSFDYCYYIIASYPSFSRMMENF